jgi:hypothetical protein
MLAKGTTIDFNGQNVYAGIDIHLKSWKVTIMSGDREHKTFSQDPNAETLRNYLRKNFPGAVYHSAYEAGADCGQFPVKPKDGLSGKIPTENHCCRT